MRFFPAPTTEVVTGSRTLLSSREITYVLKNKRSPVAKRKLNPFAFKITTFNPTLVTQGIEAILCHKTSNICSSKKKRDFCELY